MSAARYAAGMETEELSRRQLMILAVLFEGGMVAGALLLGWLTGVSFWERLWWDSLHLALGIAAALPLLLLLILFSPLSWGPLERIRRFVDEVVRPLFRRCTLLDFVIICVLAGAGEELLFRGFVQDALAAEYGPWTALVAASLLFGLLHPITFTYVVLAALAGAYFGRLYLASGNLLVPIVAHALYDFVALVWLLSEPPSPGPAPPVGDSSDPG